MKMKLLAENFLKFKEELYFVSKDTNLIFKINLNTGILEFIDCIPEESAFTDRLCSKILFWNNEFIFVPMNANKVWRYNLITRKWHGIKLGEYGNRKNKIYQAIIYENNLFMIGCSISAIFQLNLITEEVLIIDEPLKELEKKKKYPEDSCFRYDFVQNGKEIYMASCLDNSVMKFNMSNQKVDFYEVGDKGNLYSGIAWDGKEFWLSPRYKTSIVRWDGKNEIAQYELPQEELEEESGFQGIVAGKNQLVIPGKRKYSIIVTKDTQGIAIKIEPKTYAFFKKKDDCIFSLDFHGELKIESDKNRQIYNIVTDKDSLRKFQSERINENNFCGREMNQESVFYNLDDIACCLLHRMEACITEKEIAGRHIFKIIRENS